nr:hypothetical protein [uncultured Desulfobacter sp.]
MQKTKIYFVFLFSGVAGLGYEVLWTRMLSVSLGHEIVSVLAVVSAFFSGIALGAWLLDRPVSRSAKPARWYAALEIIMGLWALILVFTLPALNPIVSKLIGLTPSFFRHWGVSFLYPFIILLPATLAMGGTLPAIDRFLEKSGYSGNEVAGLYSANTFGAVLGTLIVTFFLIPAMGMDKSAVSLMLINFICAAGILLISRRNALHTEVYEAGVNMDLAVSRVYLILFVTGFLGIGFEVMIVRVLSQILENTIFSFSDMLMVFLLGTAMGAALYQKIRRSFDFGQGLSVMLISTAFFCLVSIFALAYVEPVFHVLQEFWGKTFQGAVAAELSISFLFFLLPTISMGATFSHLAQSLKGRDGGVGRALCLNTLGGALAPICFGVLLLPEIGIKYCLLLIPMLYLLCIPRVKRSYLAASVAIILLAILIVQKPDANQFISLSKGDKIVYRKEGVMASVCVIKDQNNGLHLKVNNRYQMGGTTSVFSDRRQAYLPMLLHRNPQKVLFLGLGSGTTFATAGSFPDLDATGVELIPEVIEAVPFFKKVTGDLTQFKNLHIVNADARRYVSATDGNYDIIIADLFHPSRDGAASLYTLEHFRAIKKRLNEKGLFCQWLPLYQLDMETFKIITRTFMTAFPEGQAFLAHYSIDQPIIGLIGGQEKLRFSENWYTKRVRGKSFMKVMSGYGYDSIYSLLGSFVAGSDALKSFSTGVSLNTDENPIVLFQAPRFVYGTPEEPKDRLMALLSAFSPPDPETILAEIITEHDYLARPKLKAYWSARDRFLEVGTVVERTRDPFQLYKTASDPLLEVVRKSSDFSAAYFPLLSIAYEIYPKDRNASFDLLSRLERANSKRPEARILKSKLFDSAKSIAREQN